MQKEQLVTNQRGFSLVEVMLSTSVFVLLVTALVGAYLYGQEATMLAGNRTRATLLAEEGLEAVRNIRDAGFTNLTDGTHGLTTTGNQWNLSGTSDVADIFTRQVIISSVDAKRKSVTANVTWQQNPQRTGLVSVINRTTNWIAPAGGGAPASSCDLYCQLLPAGYTTGICRVNSGQCTANGEVYESGGDTFCVAQPRCCCKP